MGSFLKIGNKITLNFRTNYWVYCWGISTIYNVELLAVTTFNFLVKSLTAINKKHPLIKEGAYQPFGIRYH